MASLFQPIVSPPERSPDNKSPENNKITNINNNDSSTTTPTLPSNIIDNNDSNKGAHKRKRDLDVQYSTLSIENILVDKSMLPVLECTICLGVLTNSYQCMNGHTFCLKCIEHAFRSGIHNCPTCKCVVNSQNISKCLFIENLLNNQMARCQYSFKYDEQLEKWVDDKTGCTAVMTYEQIKTHQPNCDHRPMICKFNDDCGSFKAMYIVEHESNCRYRLVKCTKCLQDVQFQSIKSHSQSQCALSDIQCNHCGKSIVRKDLPNHIKMDCPNVRLSCAICSERIYRCEMDKHISQTMVQHLLTQQKKIDLLSNQIATQKYIFFIQQPPANKKSIYQFDNGGFTWDAIVLLSEDKISVQLVWHTTNETIDVKVQTSININNQNQAKKLLNLKYSSNEDTFELVNIEWSNKNEINTIKLELEFKDLIATRTINYPPLATKACP